MPEPGPAGWTAERLKEVEGGAMKGALQGVRLKTERVARDLTCLQNARSMGSHQGADWMGK